MTGMPTPSVPTRPFRFAAMLLAAHLVAAPLLAVDVKTDHDREADFANRKTYAWKAGTEAPNPLTEQKIRMAVEANLRAKGLTRVESSPDHWVVTHTTATMESRIDVSAFGYGGGWSWNGWYSWGPSADVRIRDTTTGMLLVDVLDGAKATLIWRGIASDTIRDLPDPDKLAKTIDKAVKKMFQDFPPKPEKKK